MNSNPKVSILLPVYNFKDLTPTISSLLCQTYDDFELLICDDGSTPPIRIPSFNDNRIKSFRNKRNLGLGKNLNRLLSLSSKSSKYFTTSEQDDIYKPYFLEECVNFLEKNTDIGIASGVAEFWNSEGELYKFPGLIADGFNYPNGEEMFLLNYKRQIKVPFSCMVIRKEVHQKHKLFFTSSYPSLSVDWDYILRFSLISRIKGINTVFVRKDRTHDRQSLTTKSELVYKTSKKLLLDYYKKYPRLISFVDYRYALSSQLYLELGNKKFLNRIFSLFYDILLLDPDKNRFINKLVNELSKIRIRITNIKYDK